MSNLGKYLASQIAQNKMVYEDIILIYPQYKEEIDEYLKEYFANSNIIPLES